MPTRTSTAPRLIRSEGAQADAVRDASAAIRLKAGRPEYYQVRATAQLGIGAFAGAVADANRVIELDPTGPNTYMAYDSRGVAKVYMG